MEKMSLQEGHALVIGSVCGLGMQLRLADR
jgi:hypothetical protein